jgi:alpha-beta hydrolase superfamily lysophospholipase
MTNYEPLPMSLGFLDSLQNAIGRRDFFKASVITAASATSLGLISSPATAQEPSIEVEEHWVMKGPVRLYLFRKRQPANASPASPLLFLVHGSTFSGRGSYDLVVPGRTGYSAMDHFAALGYDVWTMDHEGYGFSSRTAGNSGIQSGVEDLKAALSLIEKVTGRASVFMFGESSGAIRAGAFAMVEPNRVERLVLHAFTYTGENAPEIDRRRALAEFYKTNPHRPFGISEVQRIFDRDVAGKTDPVVIQALADFELKFGDSVPSGAYLDMATNLPLVDPKRLDCPVCLVRPEYDGNASEEELYRFFRLLASKDKQFVFMRAMTHAGAMIGSQRQRLWHVIHAFLTCPAAPPA